MLPRHLRPFHAVVAVIALFATAVAQAPVLAGRVRTGKGEVAGNAEILLRWRSGPELPGLCGISLGDRGVEQLTATADARGMFKLVLPHRGPFEVTASGGGERSTPEFPVMAGSFVDLQLRAPVRVGGRAVGPDDKPLAHVAVELVPTPTAWSKFAAYRLPEPRGATVTDADGRFELPFQDSYLRGNRWEGFMQPHFGDGSLVCRPNLLLRPTNYCRDLQLELVARKVPQEADGAAPALLPTLHFRLLRGGAPLRQAAVLWSTPVPNAAWRESRGRTDAAGCIAVAHAAAGASLFGFVQQGEGWLPFCRLQVPMADSDLGDVDVSVRAVNGQVVDGAGLPLAGARVVAMNREMLSGELPYVTWTDHGGRFCFAALPGGQLQLWADCGAHGFASTELASGQREVTLQPPLTGTVAGATLDAAGKPLADAWVVLVRQNQGGPGMPGIGLGNTFLCVHSDAEGRVRITGLPPGPWQVLSNAVRDGLLYGGGSQVDVGDEFVVVLRLIRE